MSQETAERVTPNRALRHELALIGVLAILVLVAAIVIPVGVAHHHKVAYQNCVDTALAYIPATPVGAYAAAAAAAAKECRREVYGT